MLSGTTQISIPPESNSTHVVYAAAPAESYVFAATTTQHHFGID